LSVNAVDISTDCNPIVTLSGSFTHNAIANIAEHKFRWAL